jgi:hypothetical protein
MLFQSSSGLKRQLVLFCVWLLVQCVMASSIPKTGMDEVDLKGIRTSKTLMSVTSGHDPWLVCQPLRLPTKLGCDYL